MPNSPADIRRVAELQARLDEILPQSREASDIRLRMDVIIEDLDWHALAVMAEELERSRERIAFLEGELGRMKYMFPATEE